MARHFALFATLTLLLSALACGLPIPASPSESDIPTPDIVSTMVSATLTAVVPAPSEEASPTPALAPAPSTILTIVYSRGGNILLWREGETPRTLTTTGIDEQPRISDDGQMIVFLRNGELYAIRADGTGERPLITRAYLDTFRAAGILEVRIQRFDFIPASRDIFFSLYAETDGYPMPFDDLQRVNAETAETKIILPQGRGGGNWTFSPAGKFFALSQGNQIRVLRPDGSEDRVVFTFDPVSTYSEWTYYPEIVWRNDEEGFYTVIPASTALENPSQPTRYYYIPLSGMPAQLAEFVTVPVWESFPRLAPNGMSVAYVRPDSGSQSLHIIDLSTADLRLQTASRIYIENWNPNARHVTFYNPEMASDVFAQAAGEAPAQLNDSPSGWDNLRWVSERRFLFRTSAGELRLRDGSAPSIVLDTGITEYDFTLAP
ncbi:MAG: hypothetical protein DDG60_13340 [Anaerolineae bacterium]|nr:MAG: hypothetical protein DDG60_13340 [Anaerolineae bacterium]